MSNYIDGFVFPIAEKHLEEYRQIAESVASIWKEHGALSYQEYVADDLSLEGTRSFAEAANVQDGEVIIFGWVVFTSREARDLANKNVPLDPRMENLVGPLVDPNRLIFNATRMIYGGFKPLIHTD